MLGCPHSSVHHSIHWHIPWGTSQFGCVHTCYQAFRTVLHPSCALLALHWFVLIHPPRILYFIAFVPTCIIFKFTYSSITVASSPVTTPYWNSLNQIVWIILKPWPRHTKWLMTPLGSSRNCQTPIARAPNTTYIIYYSTSLSPYGDN